MGPSSQRLELPEVARTDAMHIPILQSAVMSPSFAKLCLSQTLHKISLEGPPEMEMAIVFQTLSS